MGLTIGMSPERMKEFDWRLRYAPNGYAFYRQRLSFATLDFARYPIDVFTFEMDYIHRQLEQRVPGFNPSIAHTFITIWPKDMGENLNHLDPLKPRLGIQIEVRVPVKPSINLQS